MPSAQFGVLPYAVGSSEEQYVLSVEPLDLLIPPNLSTNAIDGQVIVDFEERRPIVRPLLVQMPSATLKRNRRRKSTLGANCERNRRRPQLIAEEDARPPQGTPISQKCEEG